MRDKLFLSRLLEVETYTVNESIKKRGGSDCRPRPQSYIEMIIYKINV
nr:MAG TPA: hypothetical protein [Caudoviricetes sp.]